MKKTLSLKQVCLLVPGILFALGADAAMYKWVDEAGNTHYTESPPPGDIIPETIKAPPKVDTESAGKELENKKKMVEKLQEKRTTSAEEKLKAEKEKAEKDKQCEQAKKRLASYQRPKITVKQADGSQRSLPEEERQAEIKKSEDYIRQLCN